MPSKYKSKDQKKRYNIQKQDAALPYKQHYKPTPELEMCPNCGYTRPKYSHTKYSKCYCGCTFQSGSSLSCTETSAILDYTVRLLTR